MRQYCQGGHLKQRVLMSNKTLESDAINHSYMLCHPAHDDEKQQRAAALQRQQQQDSYTQSSNSRNT